MPSINDVRAAQNPQKAFEWNFRINGSSAGGNLPVLDKRVETVTLPQKSVETIEINYKGRKTFHSGRDASGHTFAVTFWDTEGGEVYRFFNDWIENGISNSVVGGGTTRDQYAAESIIEMLAADSETVVESHTMTNVFPTEIADISLSYEASEIKKVEVTFSFDSQLMAD